MVRRPESDWGPPPCRPIVQMSDGGGGVKCVSTNDYLDRGAPNWAWRDFLEVI